MNFLFKLRLFLLGAWIGAAIFFSAAVAPSVFRVLRGYSLTNASEIAGSIVGQTLFIVNVSGFVIGLILLLTAFLKQRRSGRAAFLIQLVLLPIMTVATGIGEWFIARRLRVLRSSSLTPIDHLPLDDPIRVAFDSLHGYSVAALSIAIIAALITFFVISKRTWDNV